MTGLVDPRGRPISSKDFQNKKAPTPDLGERYGQWAGEQAGMMSLPGGGAITFDLSRLTLADYRQMKEDYQINSSLSILTFMMHQMEWHIECEDKKMGELIENNLREVWSRLVRGMSQALWAGYSPNVLQWENDVDGKRVVLNKVKDLLPEDCKVQWLTVEGKAPPGGGTKPKFQVYDGINQVGSPRIPVDNSYWYPLLMENGNYYGRQLLRPAFQPWFFSVLMHLFANRYYERFGEPTPVGRAPYEDEITVDGKTQTGNKLMGDILSAFRSRSVVVLPNEKTPFGNEANPDFDYQIEYLESQMRGADFERYLTRLDEEKSLAMFTPILMMRTADVGSYNLGTQHTQVYQWMLNAFSGDWAHYIDKYIIRPLNWYNSPKGFNATPARIKFVKMGKVDKELLKAIIVELFQQNRVKYDTREIGDMAGLTFAEIEQVTEGEEAEPNPSRTDPKPAQPASPDPDGTQDEVRRVTTMILNRINSQASKAFRSDKPDLVLSLGYRSKFKEAVWRAGYTDAESRTAEFYDRLQLWLDTMTGLGKDEFEGARQFVNLFDSMMNSQLEGVLR